MYALNNPINMSDSEGRWPKWLKKVAVGVAVIATCAVVSAVAGGIAGGTVGYIAAKALKGAVVGGAANATVGAVKSVAKNRVKSGSFKNSGKAALSGGSSGFMAGTIGGTIGGVITGATEIHSAASSWDKGNFGSSRNSMEYHYKKHGLENDLETNIVDYTQDALDFAERNTDNLQFTVPSRDSLKPGFRSNYTIGQGGWYTPDGKILTFWYK